MAASITAVQERFFKARSRALRREGQTQRSLRLQGDKNSLVKAVLTRHAPGLSFFKKGERNLIIRAAGQHIGDFFITDYLPLRFDRGYAGAVLYYRPSKKYEQWKAIQLGNGQRDDRGGVVSVDTSQNQPLVLTGALRESVFQRSYAVSRAANGRFSVVVRMPTPATSEGFRYSNNKEVRKVLRALPMKEVKALTNRMGRFIQMQIGRSTFKARVFSRPRGQQGPVRAPTAASRLGKTQRSVLREQTTGRNTLHMFAPARRTLRTSATFSREVA